MSEAVQGGALGVNFTRAAAAAMGRARDVSRSSNGVVRHRDGRQTAEGEEVVAMGQVEEQLGYPTLSNRR